MRRHLALLTLLLSPLAAPRAASEASADLHVTYLGNEGFLLESDGRKVLIDALVSQNSMKAFVDQSFETARLLRSAEGPYLGVDLILATHAHGDHFDPLEVGLHLTANEEAVFVSTQQAVAALKKEFGGFEGIADRVHAVTPEEGTPTELEELGITVFNLHHGRDRLPITENNAYLFELGGHRLLHMGDSEATAEELAPLELAALEIDVGFVPSWYLGAEPWEGAIQETVKPDKIVVMHLAPRWAEEVRTHNQSQSRKRVKHIRATYPKVVVFEAYGAGEIFSAPE